MGDAWLASHEFKTQSASPKTSYSAAECCPCAAECCPCAQATQCTPCAADGLQVLICFMLPGFHASAESNRTAEAINVLLLLILTTSAFDPVVTHRGYLMENRICWSDCVQKYIYIYIYIERERERETYIDIDIRSVCVCAHLVT